MYYANETAAFGMSDDAQFADRANFVRNLGFLLAQTRDGIDGCELDERDIVTIHFKHGETIRVNVECDSYIAIIRDVARSI